MREPNTGELNRRIVIKAWQDMPVMGGSIAKIYDAELGAWAKCEPIGNAIFFGTQQLEESVTDRFIVRRTSQITERTITGEHVIECEGQRFRVKRASAMNGSKNFVVIETEGMGNV